MKSLKSFIKKFFVRLLVIIGALTLVGIIIVVIGLAVVLPAGKAVPDRVILEVDFEKPLVEYVPPDPVALALMREVTTVRDVIIWLQHSMRFTCSHRATWG